MKKIIIVFLLILLSSTVSFAKKSDEVETVPLFNSKLPAYNSVWAGTFQLLWNDLEDNVVQGPIVFSNGQIKLAEELNKQNFDKTMIDDNSFYTNHGFMTKEFKKTIEQDLKAKFNDKSDVLNSLDWNGKDFLAYAMLKKDFQFLKAFDKLKNDTFGKSKKKVAYFGIENDEELALSARALRVMFYNSDKDFAINIYTKTKDRVILYRTDETTSFEEIYNKLLDKSRVYDGHRDLRVVDKLKIPYIEFDTKHVYDELSGKHIKGTEMTIDKALQTIKFKMDNKGVQLKSEAVMITKMSFMRPKQEPPRNFYFNDTFVLFLIENDKPYFALRVNNDALLK